jgi:hypothetical protein
MLHSRSIILRDRKPAHIFVDSDWIVRIGDFSHPFMADEELHDGIFDGELSLNAHVFAITAGYEENSIVQLPPLEHYGL